MKTRRRSGTTTGFLWIWLVRASLAAAFGAAANLLPAGGVALLLWRWALHLDPHQEIVALRRACVLLERRSPDAWRAFEEALDILDNRRSTSASDLYLSRLPGTLLRRVAARLLWGAASPADDAWRDERLRNAATELAAGHTHSSLAADDLDRAERAVDAWHRLEGTRRDREGIRWARAEIAWRRGDAGRVDDVRGLLGQAIERGAFPSPFDALTWTERLLTEDPDLAEGCSRWARLYLPEIARTWTLTARLARSRGAPDDALRFCERALSFDPQDLEAFFLRLALDRGLEDLEPYAGDDLRFAVEAPVSLELDGRGSCVGRLEGRGGAERVAGWTLFVLPPAGWGLLPEVAEARFAAGRAEIPFAARRPHRVRGEPWPLVLVAAGPGGYLVERRRIAVADAEPGRILVTVTEDHEIHEERGSMPIDQLRRLLVEKSRFAADRGIPWTHMVETGSTLALPRWAAGHRGGRWHELEHDLRRHLVDEVCRGHDVQPHLHAFNDPRSGLFPYRAGDDALQTPLDFLLTSAERRGDWASVCPSPGSDKDFDRLTSVEASVADLEEVAQAGSPDYRAVLWRSGLLEYGLSVEDQAWSAVALRRAGLLAVSDVAKPASPRRAARPAFAMDWRDSSKPTPGGPLVQLPIAANLEGDYRMGPRVLRRRARSSVAAIRRADGKTHPGVHLFTLITHDKFLNARRGGDEFQLDPEAGDWRILSRHAKAWREAGATFVTAREGVEALVDDLTWLPVPRLRKARFEAADTEDGEGYQARFRMDVLGRGIQASEAFPRHLLVPIPCFLRPHLLSVRIEIGETLSTPELEILAGRPAAFWIRRADDRDVTVRFSLASSFPPGSLDGAVAESPAPAEKGP